MEWYESGALIIGLVVGLIALSVPVAFAFLVVSVIGMLIFIGGEAGLKQITVNATSSITLFVFVPIPMFILMGELFFHARMANRVFDKIGEELGK